MVFVVQLHMTYDISDDVYGRNEITQQMAQVTATFTIYAIMEKLR